VPPGAAPPGELEIEDLAVGEGPEAQAGQAVEVHYVGVAWSTRQQFDASWSAAHHDPAPAGLRLGRRRRCDQGRRDPGVRRRPPRRRLSGAA
jgi:hypothetical protein